MTVSYLGKIREQTFSVPQYGVYGAYRAGGGTEVRFPNGTPFGSVFLGGLLSDD